MTSRKKKVVDISDYMTEVATALEQAGAAPELIHAFLRTGMLVTDENLRQWSNEDLAKWDAAIEEHRRLEKRTE